MCSMRTNDTSNGVQYKRPHTLSDCFNDRSHRASDMQIVSLLLQFIASYTNSFYIIQIEMKCISIFICRILITPNGDIFAADQ